MVRFGVYYIQTVEISGRKWGIPMLMGEFHHNIDEKNRLVIPSKFRSELGEVFIVTRGLDGCLFVYSHVYTTDHGSFKYITKVNQVQYVLLPFLVNTCGNWGVKQLSPGH